MTYEINVTDGDTSNFWKEKSGDLRILQNVRNLIVNLMMGELQYNRVRGFDTRLLDRPVNTAAFDIKRHITELIDQFEPLATVESVRVSSNRDGNLSIVVEVDIE